MRSDTGEVARMEAATLSARARWALSLGALAVLAVTLLQWALSLFGAAHSEAGRYDFSSYYAAAAALRANPHANIYDPAVLARAGAAGHVLVNPPLPYTYPPLFALLLSPLTTLSFRTLSRIWLFGNAALWLAIAVLLAFEIRALIGDVLPMGGNGAIRDRPRLLHLLIEPSLLVSLALAAWLCLTSAPASQTLATGQINFLVLAPLALIPSLTRHGHERWVGVMVALAAMLKFTPALLIAYLLLRRRWQAALSAVVALFALALISIAVDGPGVFFGALTQALSVGTGDAALGHNEALFAPLTHALTLANPSLGDAVQLAFHLLTAALAVLLGYVLWRRTPRPTPSRRTQAASELAAYGITLCAMVLLSPATWVHHYVWVLPAAAIALGLAVSQLARSLGTAHPGQASLLLGVVALASAALGWGLPYNWDTEPHPLETHLLGLPLWPLLLMLRPLGTLAIALVLALWLRAANPAPSQAQQIQQIYEERA
jgi:hypothetical protein